MREDKKEQEMQKEKSENQLKPTISSFQKSQINENTRSWVTVVTSPKKLSRAHSIGHVPQIERDGKSTSMSAELVQGDEKNRVNGVQNTPSKNEQGCAGVSCKYERAEATKTSNLGHSLAPKLEPEAQIFYTNACSLGSKSG